MFFPTNSRSCGEKLQGRKYIDFHHIIVYVYIVPRNDVINVDIVFNVRSQYTALPLLKPLGLNLWQMQGIGESALKSIILMTLVPRNRIWIKTPKRDFGR